MIHAKENGRIYRTNWKKFEFFNLRKDGIFYPLPCIEFTRWEYTNPNWSRIKIIWLWYIVGWGKFTVESEE